jgi:transglutaminase-like putative cysteine protease
MKLTIAVEMAYQVHPADPALLTITVAPMARQAILDSRIEVAEASLRWVTGEGGLGHRVWAHVPGPRLAVSYHAQVQVDRTDPDWTTLQATAMPDMPAEALTYLRASAYCPSDRFGPFVQQNFGHLQGGAKVAAMSDWVAQALRYRPGASHAATTALDTFVAGEGVCRDYAHLICSLARAAGIPARYVSGYSPGVTPPDFHACAEVWLDGGWHVVDPTGMSTSAGLAIIGAGRDAADVAFMETAQPAQVVHQEVRVGRG